MIPYATSNDIARCKRVIELELRKNSVIVDSKELDKLTVEIMDLAYAKGGSYSNKTIKQFAKAYIAHFRL